MGDDVNALIADLFAVIQALGGYAPPTVPPQVHRVAQQEIQERFCRRPCAIRAIYDPTLGVFIDEKLDVFDNAFDRSILLHELVHHVQAVSGNFDLGASNCSRKNLAEREAYYIQNRYLVEINDGHRVSMNSWIARCDDAEVPTPQNR